MYDWFGECVVGRSFLEFVLYVWGIDVLWGGVLDVIGGF